MRRDARVLLTDIDQAGADIQLFTDGMDGTAYAADARTQAAVERKFEIISEAVNEMTAKGFRFGGDTFEVVHFAFHFYGLGTWNLLINPNNLLVQAVLTHMLEDEDYLFFALSPDGRATAFRSEVGQDVLFYVRANLPLLQASATTEAQYDLACLSFARNPRPPGPLLHWVCRDRLEYLDLSTDRSELTPASS